MTSLPRRGCRRLFRVLTIASSLFLLLVAAAVAYLWLLHIQFSMEAYRPPISTQPRPTDHATAPLASQVVLVIIDGLRADAALGMPTLSSLQRQGASAQSLAQPPTYSQPSWTTLVTGAWPELNGAALLNAPEAQIGLIPVDHIFAAAHRANLSTALAGSSWWSKMIPHDLLDARYLVQDFDAAADQQVADTGIRFLHNFHPNLTLIYFGNVDEVGHQAGAQSQIYQQAALQVDSHLQNIVGALDLKQAVLIVTSDHGHIAPGGHGGNDSDVVTTPFIAVGDSIIPGDYGTISQTDIAPTIAAILGAPLPASSMGSIRFEMLRTDDIKRAETQVDAALQHRDLANLYIGSIQQGKLSDSAEGDVAVAASSLQVLNYGSAYELGGIAIARINQEMFLVRQRRIEEERHARLPRALLFAIPPLLLFLWRGGRRGTWLLASAIATLLIYNVLFLRAGRVYSFSVITGFQPFIEQTLPHVALAALLGAFLVLWRLVRDHEGSALQVVQTSLGYSLLVVYLLGCQAAYIYWQNGFRLSWYIPNMELTFWQISTLLQIVLHVIMGLVIPIIFLLAGLLYQGALALNRRNRALMGGR